MKILCPCGATLNTGAKESIEHMLVPLRLAPLDDPDDPQHAESFWDNLLEDKTVRIVWLCAACGRMAVFQHWEARPVWYERSLNQRPDATLRLGQ